METVSRGKDRVAGQVYETTDYAKFRTLDGNRGVEEARKARLRDSINKIGRRVVPIVVNERMEVIDGQGRLAVLREMGLPVLYVIDKTAGIEECRRLNIGMKNWSLPDFINSYADSGNAEFAKLRGLVEEFAGDLPLGTILSATSCAKASKDSRPIREGTFKCRRPLPEIEADLRFIRENAWLPLRDRPGRGKFEEFYQALLFVLRLEQTDRGRLGKVCAELFADRDVVFGGSAESMVRLLEDRYNYRLGKDNRMDFQHLWKSMA